MDSLPQELVDHICSYLDYNDLKITLLLSRKFQYAAEQLSRAFEEYTLTAETAPKFISVYSGRQARYLREVKIVTTIPPVGNGKDSEEEEEEEEEEKGNCRESATDLRDIDEGFTRQIQDLFEILRTVHTRSGASLRIHLTVFEPTRAIDEEPECYHRIFPSWRVHLLSRYPLPSLDCVHTLTIKAPERDYPGNGPSEALWRLDLRVILELAQRMPKLELLRCKLGGDEWQNHFAHAALKAVSKQWAGPRRDSRHDFGKGLEGMQEALPLLQHVQLDFLYPYLPGEYIDQRKVLPNLMLPAAYDPFSSSLRLLSYRLRTLSLRVVADKTLFWPANGTTPFWPNLETLSVMFHMSTPSGSWYFHGLPGVGATQGYRLSPENSYPPLATTDQDLDEDEQAEWFSSAWPECGASVSFRTYPTEELTPFLYSFAKATAYMPSLKEFILWSPLSISSPPTSGVYENFDATEVTKFPNHELAWGIAYARPGMSAFVNHPGENNADKRQIWWRVGRWRPNDELHDLFRDIGSERHGADLSEYWNDDYAGQGLDWRDTFRWWEEQRWDVDVE